MTRLDRQQHVLDLLVPQLEEDGYSVFIQPPRSLLPKFMAEYRPDAVAMGKPKNLAIEIVQGEAPAARLGSLSERFAGRPDWELRVYYYQPDRDDEALSPPGREAIEAAAATVEGLVAAGQPEAGLLIGWSALEALGRFLLPQKLRRPQTAGRLLESIAQAGVVTPDEAERLRALQAIRTRVAHGDLGASVRPEQVADLVAILRAALAETGPVEAAP